MGAIHYRQARLAVSHARRLNERNPLMRLPIDVLHILLHHVETSWSFVLLRQTSSILRGLIDETGLVVFNRSDVSPFCRRAECSKSFTWTMMLYPEPAAYEELAQRLPSAVGITLQLSPELQCSSLEDQDFDRWSRVCDALSHPAPHLREVLLQNLKKASSREPGLTVWDNIFNYFAPSLRSATLLLVRLRVKSEGLPIPLAFASLRSLEYQPPGNWITTGELKILLTSLPQLKMLTLRIIYIDNVYGIRPMSEVEPIAHQLSALRIDNLRRGHYTVYHLLYKGSTTLRRFEARARISEWWLRLHPLPERHRELAVGLGITELTMEPTDSGSGPNSICFYHSSRPEKQVLIRANAQWLTKVTLHHILWPGREPLPEAPCLTNMHVLMTECDVIASIGYGESDQELQDIFLATEQTAWRVPALRTFSLSYVISEPTDHCTSEYHTCCREGYMLVSAELLAKVISELFVFEKVWLDVIQLNCIKLYEPRPVAMSMLKELACDIVQSSILVSTSAIVHVPSRLRLPPLHA